jgi:hypothetical protein
MPMMTNKGINGNGCRNGSRPVRPIMALRLDL